MGQWFMENVRFSEAEFTFYFIGGKLLLSSPSFHFFNLYLNVAAMNLI